MLNAGSNGAEPGTNDPEGAGAGGDPAGVVASADVSFWPYFSS